MTACSTAAPAPVEVKSFCPLAVHPNAKVRSWFKQQVPTEEVNEYLFRIGIQQEDIDKHCH